LTTSDRRIRAIGEIIGLVRLVDKADVKRIHPASVVFVPATGTGMVKSSLTGPLFSGEADGLFSPVGPGAPVPTSNRAGRPPPPMPRGEVFPEYSVQNTVLPKHILLLFALFANRNRTSSRPTLGKYRGQPLSQRFFDGFLTHLTDLDAGYIVARFLLHWEFVT
jgi:hypothetical protein